jgi:hypothetical protein
MVNGPNRQTIYGPLELERHVKDDGRKLIIYTRHRSAKAQMGSASASA